MLHAAAIWLLAIQQAAVETVDIPGTKLKFELVAVPGGKATVGSPDGKERALELKPFKLGARELSWAEFNAFHTNPKDIDAVTRPTHADSYFGDAGIPKEFLEAKRPLTNVRWHSAVMYCEWLSRKTGAYYRLPTEAEWEHAARAGSDKPGPDDLNGVAWHKGNSDENTHPGGGKKANAFGLYDMIGNVWEYVLEPVAPPEYGPVLKGGCWSSAAKDLKFAARQAIPYAWFKEDDNKPRSVWWLTASEVSIGFRVACAADASDRKEREEYAPKVAVQVAAGKEKKIMTGTTSAPYRTVTGEIWNGGDRALEEVELKVYYLKPDGSPHLVDLANAKPGRAAFSKCWPVMANTYADETARPPLKPGESRTFTLDLPLSYDLDVNPGVKVQFGATVTALKFVR